MPSSIVNAIYKAREDAQDRTPRPHLGASLLGHVCERFLWLTFRHGATPNHRGQILRLFETGQLEEDRFKKDLERIGITVFNQQDRVSALGGHFRGSIDGMAIGIPDDPDTVYLVEFKTHGEKSFKELEAKGVKASKPMHYAQMQCYMGLKELPKALYMAVNKNTDALYTEIVDFDPSVFADLMRKAENVINAMTPPRPLSTNPMHWECKFCDFYEVCFGGQTLNRNCRTCQFAEPIEGGWQCNKFDRLATGTTCPEYRINWI